MTQLYTLHILSNPDFLYINVFGEYVGYISCYWNWIVQEMHRYLKHYLQIFKEKPDH